MYLEPVFESIWQAQTVICLGMGDPSLPQIGRFGQLRGLCNLHKQGTPVQFPPQEPVPTKEI